MACSRAEGEVSVLAGELALAPHVLANLDGVPMTVERCWNALRSATFLASASPELANVSLDFMETPAIASVSDLLHGALQTTTKFMFQVLCPGSGLNGMCNGVGCEIDILGAEERARRAQGAKRLPHEHPTPDLSALMNSDLREQTMAIWRDIVREAGGVRSTSMEILGRPQRRILQSLPPAGQIGELRGSASVEGFGKAADSREGGLNPSQRTCFSIMDNIHRPQLQEDLSTGASTGLRPNCHVRHLISYALSICLLKNVIPAVAEIKEALQALTDELQEGLPSISGSVRAAMAPVSLAVGLGTLYGMYRVNRSRL
ncbi:hypothetical protein cyc_01337 [Cyclospora cayetanensis]|uniref:Uncharacterized protein n=1 Tax=Cyclospora cayetanensis TaxID=88456 RepID=A0A1D3D1D2_9EIME|nr:hypothetical protein cyc_01337 [Cyclospora cayetanensis]